MFSDRLRRGKVANGRRGRDRRLNTAQWKADTLYQKAAAATTPKKKKKKFRTEQNKNNWNNQNKTSSGEGGGGLAGRGDRAPPAERNGILRSQQRGSAALRIMSQRSYRRCWE